jgi:hypothetical protein
MISFVDTRLLRGYPWGGGTPLQGRDAAPALPFFAALLALVDEDLAAGHPEVHHAGELMAGGGVGPRLVHVRAQPPVERAEWLCAFRMRCTQLACSVTGAKKSWRAALQEGTRSRSDETLSSR